MRLQRPEKGCFNAPGNFNYPAGKLNRKGVALIWTALLIMFLILLVGLSIDTANLYWRAHQLQNAADAASLAGAFSVKTDPNKARHDAQDTAFANYANKNPVDLDLNDKYNDPNGDIVLGLWFSDTRTFQAVAPGAFANAVKVTAGCGAPRKNADVNLIFGPIAGVDTVTVSRDAIATSDGGLGAGILAQCEDACPGIHFNLSKNGEVDVTLGIEVGSIHVNSDCDCAVLVTGEKNKIVTGELNINGGYCTNPPNFDFGFTPKIDQGVLPDPLGCYPEYGCIFPRQVADDENDLSPAPGDYWVPDPNLAENVVYPGYYSGGIKINGGNVRFEPGIYILDGDITDGENPLANGGLQINGSPIIYGTGDEGVMFYVLGGSVDIGGTPVINLKELVPWVDDGNYEDYEGVIIYQDPYNTSPARIIGTSYMNMIGTLYFPFNFLELGGDGGGFGSQIIACYMEIHGSGVLGVAYDGRYNNSTITVYLVE